MGMQKPIKQVLELHCSLVAQNFGPWKVLILNLVEGMSCWEFFVPGITFFLVHFVQYLAWLC